MGSWAVGGIALSTWTGPPNPFGRAPFAASPPFCKLTRRAARVAEASSGASNPAPGPDPCGRRLRDPRPPRPFRTTQRPRCLVTAGAPPPDEASRSREEKARQGKAAAGGAFARLVPATETRARKGKRGAKKPVPFNGRRGRLQEASTLNTRADLSPDSKVGGAPGSEAGLTRLE